MAAKRVKDLVVKTGSYTVNGETKGRYLNVGSMMKSDDGSFFLLLNKTFNPAGVPGDPDRDNIIVSVFDLHDTDAAAKPAASVSATPQQAVKISDTIPF